MRILKILKLNNYICQLNLIEMYSIRKIIPSVVTCCALLCGAISITFSVIDKLYIASIFIIIAAVFDFFDGFLARLLNAKSEFGKQLDSLSDIISFGLAPSIILYRLILYSIIKIDKTGEINIFSPPLLYFILMNMSFFIVMFAALRLAKFNLDESQSDDFKGLPTPAMALYICSLGVIAEEGSNSNIIYDIVTSLGFLVPVILILSFLMVSGIKMFSLKFKSFALKENFIKYIFIIISFILFIIAGIKSFFVIIPLYILFSILLPKKYFVEN